MAKKIVPQNAVLLVGDIVSISGTSVRIRTEQSKQSGTYEDFHTVEIPDVRITQDLKTKQKIALMGQLVRDKGRYSAKIVADVATVKKAPKSAGYSNLAKIVGPVPFTVQYMPPAEGKGGFANLAIEFAGQVFNGVAFKQMAAVFGRVWREGAIAQLSGRIREREFLDNSGDTQRSVEIIAEDQYRTRILKEAGDADPFGQYGQIGGDEADTPVAQAAAGAAI